ncbi:MAG: hypothetical protein K6T86_09530 [Pirellulales bacterium]|nr:hypothetical protein [Pirellulales bacterium]
MPSWRPLEAAQRKVEVSVILGPWQRPEQVDLPATGPCVPALPSASLDEPGLCEAALDVLGWQGLGLQGVGWHGLDLRGRGHLHAA